MSTPGDDKPDFNPFDMPEGGLGPLEESAEGLTASGFEPEGLAPVEASGEEAAAPGPTEEPDLSEALPGGAAGLAEAASETVTPAPEAPTEALQGLIEKKKAGKPPKRKKQKKEGQPAGESLVVRLQKTNPYVVILGLSLLALIVAVVYLIMELADYNFDLKAQEAKQRAAMAPAVQSAPARTTAAA